MNTEIQNDFNYVWQNDQLEIFKEKYLNLIPVEIKKNLKLNFCFSDFLISFPRFFNRESCLKVIHNEI